jgi:tRNA A-37 threonylcarbamoyl transferase component Bud32
VPSPALHPPRNRLLAYGLGQLDLLESVGLEAHLQHCTHCCSRLDELPADGLVSALRSAVRAPAADSWPSGTRQADSPGIPPELESHPRYRVAALVGRGGMGTVYRAEHTLMGRPVALKVIDPHLLEHPGALARFRQEVMAAARLSHPNIVIAYDADQAGSHHFLVMEFVEGTNLANYLQARGRLAAAEACAYVRQAALGLQHAFDKGMVHRDIKPHNLMLTPGGEIKVLDFGLARFVFEQFPDEDACNRLEDTLAPHATRSGEGVSGLTAAGSMMGTLDYMAPEQARDARRADIRADIYSLGCTLYQLLTGQVPFPGGDARSKAARLVNEVPPPVAELCPELPSGLAEVVARMMAQRPEDRYQTPAAVAAALAPFTAGASRGQEEPAERAKRWLPGGRKLLAVFGMALALLTVGAVTMRVQTEQGDPEEEPSADRLTSLIRQLGDRKFAKREEASKELEALGMDALPPLRKAIASDDPEIRRRADALIRGITQRIARADVKSVPPPKGAVVLFGGKDLDGWVGRDGASAPRWKLRGGGLMEADAADIRTRETFAGPYKLHVEFRIPPDPVDTPQGRGNSGVYLHGNYEVQILDSFGPRAKAPGAIHSAPAESCGAIFGQTAPRVNACKAPGFWQGYDIEFHPPRFKDGRKEEHPRVTVFHNGVLIHDNVHILVDGTGSLGLKGDLAQPGPVMLQYLGSPVQFRNVWLVPLKPKGP